MADLVRRDPFDLAGDFADMRRAMDRLFDASLRWPTLNEASEEGTLPIDVLEHDGKVVVRASLPGFKKEGIEVQLPSASSRSRPSTPRGATSRATAGTAASAAPLGLASHRAARHCRRRGRDRGVEGRRAHRLRPHAGEAGSEARSRSRRRNRPLGGVARPGLVSPGLSAL